jgi:hypothetical protein
LSDQCRNPTECSLLLSQLAFFCTRFSISQRTRRQLAEAAQECPSSAVPGTVDSRDCSKKTPKSPTDNYWGSDELVDIGALSDPQDRSSHVRGISDTFYADSFRAEQPSGFSDYGIEDLALWGVSGN